MFDGLTERLGGIFDRLKRRGALTGADVDAALREVRLALLEADVALPVVRDFIAAVREKAVGESVLRSVTPGQQVVKIVHDELTTLLGDPPGPDLPAAAAPVVVLMVGLQGSGKTTTAGKLARRFVTQNHHRVLLASLDTRRPAAQEQLEILAGQVGAGSLPIIPGQSPLEIAARALDVARREGYDVLILDTAGRLAVDEELMAEVAAIRDATTPHEVLLVADAMTGQDAVNVARTFHERVGTTGIVLTRIDGDARGGAALSMRQITGRPIKWLGTSERMEGLEPFHPDRLAGRILGMGDVVGMVEKAMATIDRDEAGRLAAKFEAGDAFTLDDMLSQLRQIRRMGGMSGLMGFLPGIGKIKDQLAKANVDEDLLARQEAIILSMTRQERREPDLIRAKRKLRIAAGSGTQVAEINRLLKQYEQMQSMMKQMKKMQKGGGLSALMGGGLPPGLKLPFR